MKTQILEAAEQEFSRTGFHNTNVSSIAERAQVGKGSVYRYFDDKLDLFTSTVIEGFRRMREKIDTVLEEETDFDQLIRIQEQYLDLFEESRELVEVVLGEGLPAEPSFSRRIARERSIIVNQLAGWFDRGISEGVFRSDFEPDELAEFFHEFTTTELRRVVLDGRELDRDRFALIRNLFLNGALQRDREVDVR